MKKIILASASPRRKEIMNKNGIEPLIMPAHIDEQLPIPMTPEASVMYLSMKKACHIADSILDKAPDTCTVIGSDTIVVHDNRIIGKPKDPREAFDILYSLKNTRHHVITGVCVIVTDGKDIIEKICLYDTSSVFFKDYGAEELQAYVNTPEPYDKAGGYAIQGTFGRYVDHVEGDVDNIIGFPFYKVERFLR